MLDPDDLVGAVREDLNFIATEFNGDIDTPKLRRASPVLRRLLVEGELQRAWRSAGFDRSPEIDAHEMGHIVNRRDHYDIRLYSCGSAKVAGRTVVGNLVWHRVEIENEDELFEQRTRPFRLQDFIDAPCMLFDFKIIRRRDIIKYVANKLGGNHHDRKRGKDEEDRLFATMDRLARESKHVIFEFTLPYLHLLSIGQSITASRDIQRFMNPDRTGT